MEKLHAVAKQIQQLKWLRIQFGHKVGYEEENSDENTCNEGQKGNEEFLDDERPNDNHESIGGG